MCLWYKIDEMEKNTIKIVKYLWRREKHMNRLYLLLTIVQILFSCIAAIYFYKSLKEKSGTKSFHQLEFRKEQEQLKKMRNIHLTTPTATY